MEPVPEYVCDCGFGGSHGGDCDDKVGAEVRFPQTPNQHINLVVLCELV